MEHNLSEIVIALEKEKCSFHRYRAMVFVENGEFRIVGCCKSFENFLEMKGKKMRTDNQSVVDSIWE
jgi:hypothetical protein